MCYVYVSFKLYWSYESCKINIKLAWAFLFVKIGEAQVLGKQRWVKFNKAYSNRKYNIIDCEDRQK